VGFGVVKISTNCDDQLSSSSSRSQCLLVWNRIRLQQAHSLNKYFQPPADSSDGVCGSFLTVSVNNLKNLKISRFDAND